MIITISFNNVQIYFYSHLVDKEKPQELQLSAIDDPSDQPPSGFRAMGDNLTDDTTNGKCMSCTYKCAAA